MPSTGVVIGFAPGDEPALVLLTEQSLGPSATSRPLPPGCMRHIGVGTVGAS